MFIKKPKVTPAQARIKLAIDYLYLDPSCGGCTTETIDASTDVTVVFKSPEVSETVFNKIKKKSGALSRKKVGIWNGFEMASPAMQPGEADNKPGFQLTPPQQQAIYKWALDKARNIIQEPMKNLLNDNNDFFRGYKLSSRGKAYIQKRYCSFFPDSSAPGSKEKELTLEDILQFLNEIKDLPLSMDVKIAFMIWYVALFFLMTVSVAALLGMAPLLGSLTAPLAALAGVYFVGVSLWAKKYQHEKERDQECLAKVFLSNQTSPSLSALPPSPALEVLRGK